MKILNTLLLILLLSAALKGQYNIPKKQLDSIKHALTLAKTDTNKVDLHFLIALANQNSNINLAIYHFNQALHYARKADHKDKILGCLLSLGFFYGERGEPAKSTVLLLEALHYTQNTNQDISMSLAFLANNYEVQGDLRNAIKYARRSYQVFEKRIKDKLPADQRGYPAGPMRMGQLFEKNGQLDSAMYYAQMAYQRYIEKPFNGGEYFFTPICNLLGNIYIRQNQPENALRYYRLAIQKAYEVNFVTSIQESQLGLANYYYQTNQKDSVIHYATQAYTGASKIKSFEIMKRAAGLLREVYENYGAYKNALFYNDLAVAARDSVSGAEKVREVQSLTFKEEQRQQKIQQEIETAKIAYQNRVKMYSLLAVLGAVLLLAFILYRNNQQKQRANALLQAQKEEINSQKTQLQNSLETIKATQAQLIQSEKLASLGELTAGIAHEIQNPLNFVNNFSELSVELAEELKEEINKPELDKGLIEELAADLAKNQEKINHHGKRAASIVRGMLEHSRTSTGVKEPTDLNALADEYLNIAYHGLRAKDNSFNAMLETHFDPDLPKIEVIPQDIGRVLLNLINNAFYAVNEKAKLEIEEYEPTVTVSSSIVGDKVEIKVKDNGNGIPEAIKDKIFQPFFTTKPTGQGTGLGLSLAYDIVTKGHGGSLAMETKEKEGTGFTIMLPLKAL
ncbi:ATP-binding protein [Haliscomenobacter sp.]|uniref:ATP-binding protein n=1 Tax=Haliscomenobacter sp. TaxID=2717303 RepID=UPI003364B6DE